MASREPTEPRQPRLNMASLKQESPPPEPTPPPMTAPLVPQMPIDHTRRQSFNRGDVNMTGTYQPTHAIPGPSPSPGPHYAQQFQPAPGARPTGVPTPPGPVNQFQLPPMMPGPPQVVQQSPMPQPPHYPPHAYTHQQQFTPGPIPPSPGHHHVPSPMPVQGGYGQPPRHIPSPAMMAPQQRTPMAPAANVNSIPHANAQQQQQQQYNNNRYEVPRSQEVYRLMDPHLEAAIPDQVREQFQRDDEGRLLWFTAAGRDRSALRGVAPEYAGLGHSISHLANIGDVREERRRKRKERDEALAREEEARKRVAGAGGSRERTEEEARVREEERRNKLVEGALLGLARQIDRGTKVVEEDLGGWREEKRLWDEERKAAAMNQGKE
ncbi:hypothetical protein CONLIGDRAFT_470716 [Coniochaeta ligniaria NRRL 30616]|uniref:Uncharacterized protein n=1 Tax=Coniochaeta ligniaria NRRL 30616 TaxID=1408157 RepID=A0A1J7J9C0_9PEZI|nr:hypothetical protein CONLIGDRAFT_470716 [Coniochaeta ligniaria NRRL 30616]